MKKIDSIFVLGVLIAAMLVVVVPKLIFGDRYSEIIGLVLYLLVIISTICIIVYRRLQNQIINTNVLVQKRLSEDYKQIESLFSIHSILKTNSPLPPMRDWAISPDFASILISLIFDLKPRLILEASSGVSTLISSYCIKKLGIGKLYSLDHDEFYASKTKCDVAQHGLTDIANVIHAPLKEVTIKEKRWLWYENKVLKEIENIDLLIIDGPPSTIQAMARYPALPLLYEKLSRKATIVLDDTLRKDEKSIVETWLKEYPDFEIKFVDTEKGATILRRMS